MLIYIYVLIVWIKDNFIVSTLRLCVFAVIGNFNKDKTLDICNKTINHKEHRVTQRKSLCGSLCTLW